MATVDYVIQQFDVVIRLADELTARTGLDEFERQVVDQQGYARWRAGATSLLTRISSEDNTYARQFAEYTQSFENYAPNVRSGRGVLEAARDAVEAGALQKLETMVSADVFGDFLEMAEHLIQQGYVHAAASLTGAVLEDGLRRIATNKGVAFRRSDGIDALNKALAQAGAYTSLVQKKVEVWRAVRNHADHAEFGEYKLADVQSMHDGVESFLATHL